MKIQKAIARAAATRLVLLLVLMLAAVGCGQETSSGTTTQDPLTPGQYGGEYAGGTATGDTEAGAAYAQWVLDQDPNRDLITDAVVRGDNSLGVKVQPDATKAEVNDLLIALTKGMAERFPDRDLQVLAFFQSGDKMAEAKYNSQSQEVDVQFTQ